tara:strand:- start:125 stop:487 length:363 start_codon:yes stop_codon:yes gene_type:complete
MSKNINKQIKKAKAKQTKVEQFSDLLDQLASTEDKKKMLWKEIYENALYDRENANILLTDMLIQVKGSIAHHTSLGSIMAKYIERMSKSNDQILRLAELIAKESEEETISSEDIFNQIQD